MKISIITCVLNNSKFIKNSLTSFKNQTYKNKEHIVIDGGSTDGTIQIIKKFKNKNLFFFLNSDKGIYKALNEGIKLSSGNIVGILHSDDFYKNNKILSFIIKTFQKTGADIIYGDLLYLTRKKPHKILRYWKAGKFVEKKLSNGWMPPHPTVFVKKNIFYKIGKYNTKYKISSDYDFLLRAMKVKGLKKVYIPKVLVNMRIGGKSNKSLKNIINKSKEDYKIIKRNKVGGLITLLSKNLSKINQFLR